MSKIITSPVKQFPGTVTISDPLSFPQSIAFEKAINETSGREDMLQQEYDFAFIPVIISCVEEWNLNGFPDVVTADNFPSTPRVASNKLIAWLIEQILSLFMEGEEVPNA